MLHRVGDDDGEELPDGGVHGRAVAQAVLDDGREGLRP
jgi:hypothetical protein